MGWTSYEDRRIKCPPSPRQENVITLLQATEMNVVWGKLLEMGSDKRGSDFVVLCEFSEKDGPVPRELLGSPSSGFPLDHFAVKLMSVELKIEVGETWSIWCEWKAQGVEYLVVHFQLHDLDARGYSRQLAIAYVSYTPKKLMKHRSIYLGALNYAAEMMMEANENDWKFELATRLQDLSEVYMYIKKDQTTKKLLRSSKSDGSSPIAVTEETPAGSSQKEGSKTKGKPSKQKKERIDKPEAIKQFEEGEDLPFPSPKTLESTYLELLRLQSKLKDHLELPVPHILKTETSDPKLALSPSFDSFYRNKISKKDAELECELGELEQAEIPIRKAPFVPNGSSSTQKLKYSSRKYNPLRELYLGWKTEQKTLMEATFTSAGISSLLSGLVKPTHAQLSHVYSLQYKNTLYDKALRSIWQLCPPALTRTLSLLRGLLDGFSHDTTVLDHIFTEHKQLLRNPSALLAIGEVPLLNFDLDALNGPLPSPASQRWLAQSKLPPGVSLAGVEFGGLDPLNMATTSHRNTHKNQGSRLSFSSLPPYLLDPYAPDSHRSLHADSSELPSPRDYDSVGSARRQLSFAENVVGSNSAGLSACCDTMSATCATHSLGLLASVITASSAGANTPGALPAPANSISGSSYISPGSPLISELAMATANAHIAHRLDYLAADLTSISTLLWPAASCPSAYFPPPSSASAQSKSSSLQPWADSVIANSDFGSFMGLGTAASYAALSSGALSMSLASSPSKPGATNLPMNSLAARFDMSNVPGNVRAAQYVAPNTFTSCVACKHASVDSMMVQLQHDAICVKSGEDEAVHLWNMKWRKLHDASTEERLSSTKEGESNDQNADNPQGKPGKETENTSSVLSEEDTPSASLITPVASPAPSLTPNSASTPTGSAYNSTGSIPTQIPSPSPSPPVVVVAPSPNNTVSSLASGGMKKSPSSGGVGATPSSNVRKSTSFANLASNNNASSHTPTNATPVAQHVPVSEMNLLHLRNRFSFLRHVIFSLLKGRPVVIHAEARHRPWVEQVIASLQCFVPGHHLSGDTENLSNGTGAGASFEQTNTPSAQYLPRQSFLAKVVPWRDARDVIFETIHNQPISGSSTKARQKHTKLVISRFLELHVQKMKLYSTVAKHAETCTSKPNSSVPPQPHARQENNKSPTPPYSNTTSPSPQPNTIPTLSTASRQALKLAHLSHVRLMGLDKSCPVPKSVERYITYWDWEAEELTCVPYEKGKLLDAMINPKKQWPDEASYRSHIHFHLSDLASRAWMYYHMCCIGLVVAGTNPLPSSLDSQRTPLSPTVTLPPSGVNSFAAMGPASSSLSASSSAVLSGSGFGPAVVGSYSPPVEHLSRNPLSAPGSPHSDWSTGARTPTEQNVFAFNAQIAPKQSHRGLSNSQSSPVSPRHGRQHSGQQQSGLASHAKTSPIPPISGDDLGFEPSSGMLAKSSSTHAANAVGPSHHHSHLGQHQTPSTPSKAKEMPVSLGPSLSSVAPSPSVGPSLNSSGMVSPRSNMPNWMPNSPSSIAGATATNPPGTPSAPLNKSSRQTPFRLSRNDSSSSIDPRLASGISAGLGGAATNPNQSTAPTPADYAFQAHCLQQRMKTSYFTSLKLFEHDAEIIEYLAELIKMQQAQDVRGIGSAFQAFSALQLNDLISIAFADDPNAPPPPPPSQPQVPGASGMPTPIKLDFTATRTFKNVLLS